MGRSYQSGIGLTTVDPAARMTRSDYRLVCYTPLRPLAARDWLTLLGGASVIGQNGIDWRDVITSSVTAANLHVHPGRTVATNVLLLWRRYLLDNNGALSELRRNAFSSHTQGSCQASWGIGLHWHDRVDLPLAATGTDGVQWQRWPRLWNTLGEQRWRTYVVSKFGEVRSTHPWDPFV